MQDYSRGDIARRTCRASSVVDAGAHLEPIEELADRVAGECLTRAISEERRVLIALALADVVDVRVQLLRGLSRSSGELQERDQARDLVRDGASRICVLPVRYVHGAVGRGRQRGDVS